jgi:hypothetical protein
LDLDHELAYSSIAEAETSSLDILSIPCNTFRPGTDDGLKLNAKSSYPMFATLVKKTETYLNLNLNFGV